MPCTEGDCQSRRSLLTKSISIALLGRLVSAQLASATAEATDEEVREAVHKAFDKTAGKTKVKLLTQLPTSQLSSVLQPPSRCLHGFSSDETSISNGLNAFALSAYVNE